MGNAQNRGWTRSRDVNLRRIVLPLGFLLLLAGGCKRQDTESLARVGRKVLGRAQTATAGFREKLDGLKLSSLHDRVAHRLRWEKNLADIPIEVIVTGNDVELKGTVKNFEQRTRAVELAEATVGVERVTASLGIAE